LTKAAYINASLPRPTSRFSRPAFAFHSSVIADNRADLTVQFLPNPDNYSPAIFLAKKSPPAGIIYKRVTPDFFVVSSIRRPGTTAATGRTAP
jgi:hypothetical protein